MPRWGRGAPGTAGNRRERRLPVCHGGGGGWEEGEED